MSSWSDPFPEFVASFDTPEQAVDFVTKASLSDFVEWHTDSDGSVWRSAPKEPDFISYQIHKVRHFPKETDG